MHCCLSCCDGPTRTQYTILKDIIHVSVTIQFGKETELVDLTFDPKSTIAQLKKNVRTNYITKQYQTAELEVRFTSDPDSNPLADDYKLKKIAPVTVSIKNLTVLPDETTALGVLIHGQR